VTAAAAEAPRAAPPVEVAVLRPAEGDRVLAEAAARLRLELSASGLPSVLLDGAADAFPDRVAFVRQDGTATIDLVGTRPDGSTAHRRVGVPVAEGGDDPAVLALRAVELLRAMRLEVHGPPPPPAPTAAAGAEAPGPPARDIVRLSLGASLLESEAGAWPATPGPTLTAGAAVVPHLSVVASLAGPYFRDLAPTPAGSAHTREELGHVGLRLDGGWTLTRLHALLGWGFHHLRAAYDTRGIPAGQPPSRDVHVRTPQEIWTPFVVVGAGVSRRLNRHLGATVEAAVLLLSPTIGVVVDERPAGGVGPCLMQTASVWVAFP
jgi:hypothetical protein